LEKSPAISEPVDLERWVGVKALRRSESSAFYTPIVSLLKMMRGLGKGERYGFFIVTHYNEFIY
jgi:hypothetical protein